MEGEGDVGDEKGSVDDCLESRLERKREEVSEGRSVKRVSLSSSRIIIKAPPPRPYKGSTHFSITQHPHDPNTLQQNRLAHLSLR